MSSREVLNPKRKFNRRRDFDSLDLALPTWPSYVLSHPGISYDTGLLLDLRSPIRFTYQLMDL
jgi:hypothetical protein